jgi:hypothetical protein
MTSMVFNLRQHHEKMLRASRRPSAPVTQLASDLATQRSSEIWYINYT